MFLRKMIIAGCLCSLVVFAGCGSNKMEDAIELTVGGEEVTGVLEAAQEQWYKVSLESGKSYGFLFKTDPGKTPVGAVYTVYWVEGEGKEQVKELMFQRHYDPNGHVQMTDESTVVSKQLAVGNFLAPKTGVYYISIQGYINTKGSKQRNSYAYTDALVYSVGVKFAATADNPQGEVLNVNAQGASVPYINKTIEVFETMYHPVTLAQGKTYQVQKRRSDTVIGPYWVDKYGSIQGSNMYYRAPYDGQFLIRVDGPGGTFGYTEYGLRVQQDDHGSTLAAATEINIGDSVSGYLGEADADWFVILIPAKPQDQQEYRRYRVTLSDRTKFELPNLPPEVDDQGNQLDSYILNQSDSAQEVAIAPVTTADYSYLNQEPDGAGSYTISVEII